MKKITNFEKETVIRLTGMSADRRLSLVVSNYNDSLLAAHVDRIDLCLWRSRDSRGWWRLTG